MKKILLTLSMIIVLTISGSSFMQAENEESEVTIQPRGPYYSNVIIVDFCDGTIAKAFYGDFSTPRRITNIGHPIALKSWSSDWGTYYKYKYIDIEGYEYIPFNDGYTPTENKYESRACGTYGS